MSQITRQLTDEYGSQTRLTESEQHQLLVAEQRRLALDELATRTAPVELSDTAVAVVRRGHEGDIDEEAVKRVATALHHKHLPKLSDAGIIDYNPNTNRIEGIYLTQIR